jgi:hypothetical protein
VGGVNNNTILTMSGGWQRSFTLAVPAAITLSFRYRLTGTIEYESDELSQMLVSLDGALLGISPNDYIAQLVGGSGVTTTGWQLVQMNLGTLSAGTHVLALGGYNSKKTNVNETTEVLIDDLLLASPAPVPPSITTQPSSVTVTEPGAANFSVVATGDVPLSYQWRRNGVDIAGATNSSYSLNPTAAADSGAQFSVFVSNAAGNVTSTAATLTVNPAPVPPSITTQPASATVTAPEAASFSVAATGDAPLAYQWRRNGVNISGATGATYVLNPTLLSDNGAQFSVVVSNTAGAVTSAAATLTVTGGGGQPNTLFDVHFNTDTDGFTYDDDLFRGSNQPNYASGNYIATGGFTGGALRVAIGGLNSQNITDMSGGWHRSFTLGAATPVTLSFRYRLTENPTYEEDEFSQALVSIDGVLYGIAPNDYIAQVIGGGPTTTGWQLVEINLGTLAAGTHVLALGGYNNQKTYPDESVEVLIDDVVLTDFTPTPPSITTQPASTTVTEPSSATFSVTATGAAPLSYQWRRNGVDISGANSSTYALNPTAMGDNGAQFTVRVSNGAGNTMSSTATLTVNPAPVPPSIITQPASQTVTEPAAASFSVDATGDAPLSYQWRRNGVDIVGAASSSYTLNPTAMADSGAQFTVRVTNAAGTVTSAAATLTVNPAPVAPSITTQPANATVTEPAGATFSVVATGDAPLSYQWMRNGTDIPGATNASYTLTPTEDTADNGAQFSVRVSNGAGNVTSTSATLTVNPAPVAPSITTQPANATVTEPAGATFSVVATGDAPLSYQWMRNGTDIPGATNASYTLTPTEDTADNGAQFSVRVSNGAGNVTSTSATLTVNPAPVAPSITTQPANATVTEPAGATFSVVAAGDAPLSYQWRKNGIEIFGATSSSYTFTPTDETDTGAQFTVHVSNAAGSVTSAAAILTVNPAPEAPSITTQPSNQTVTAPGAATFSVVATGDAPLSYQWRRNGVDIAGATSSSYVLGSTTIDDSGAQFSVMVSNAAGSVTSATATLTVNVAPSIVTSPANVTVTAPASATFTVVASGTAPFTYQWRRNGVAISGATSASYVLNPTAGSDSGATFDVVVSNAGGTATSAAATLTVNVPPAITTQPANVSVTAPATATFSVVASGTSLNYQWRRDGVDIAGATGASYVLDPTAVTDSGATFDVVVSNVTGNVTSTAATLSVLPGGTTTVIDAHFDGGTDGFAYADDLFRNTAQPTLANGSHLSSGGFSGGGLQVITGGVNGSNTPNMSGGWQRTFTLSAAGPATISLRYRLSVTNLKSDRFGQMLVSVDGVLRGVSPNDYVHRLDGGLGGLTATTGWQTVQIDLGTLAAGTHNLALGGYLSRKSGTFETSDVIVDDVILTVQQ